MLERIMYFVRKVFKGTETHYQKTRKLVLVFIVAARKLHTYFHGYKILVQTNYHILQDVKKPDLARRIVSWVVELSKYDIQYVLRGSIKYQTLADFVVEFSSHADKEMPP